MHKVSVIIPVYNAEPYIERCANSLFKQTLESIEYIFVDDCSDDRSIEKMLQVLEQYPSRKESVKIIRHKTNQGVSVTRQDGVDEATGEYIIHCDADDYLELDAYETAYNEAIRTNADLVFFDFDSPDMCPRRQRDFSSIEILKSISGASTEYVHGAMWNKLIRSDVAKSHRFNPGISFCEDTNMMFQILRDDLKVSYIHRILYHYENNPNSICKKRSRKDLDTDYTNILHINMLGREIGGVLRVLKSRNFCSHLFQSLHSRRVHKPRVQRTLWSLQWML